MGNDNPIVIAEAVRSAVGRAHKGTLALKRPDELGGDVVRALLQRVPQVKPEMVDDIKFGCAMPEGEQGLNVARLIGLLGRHAAGNVGSHRQPFLLQRTAGHCRCRRLDRYRLLRHRRRRRCRVDDLVPMTGFHLSASPELMDKMPTAHTPMGITAENVAKRFDISREAQDAFAYASQMKAKAAQENGVFKDEIVPVRAVSYKDGERVYSQLRHRRASSARDHPRWARQTASRVLRQRLGNPGQRIAPERWGGCGAGDAQVES